MKHKMKKIIAIINMLLILLSCTQNVFAVTVNDNVKLYAKGECDYTLQANDGNGFYPLTCTYVEYIDEDGVGHPAYCVNRGIDGIGEYYSYDVNLTELMQDQRLWRVAVNGFPNKTAIELGVENDYDAFFATKQAVYAILGNFNLDTHYRAVNERGEKIITAIKKLVNEGLYGTVSYKSPSVNIRKNGNIATETIEGKKYLVQKYNVASEFALKSYEVSIQNAPAGTKIFDAKGIETSIHVANKFKIAIPYSSLEKDINCTIHIKNAELKTYPVFYGKSSIAGTQNYMVTTNSFELADTKIALKLNTNNASIDIIKKDEDSGETISNTTFALYNAEGKQISTATTDSNGVTKFSKLYPGKYTIKETEANKDYVLNIDGKDITIQYGETAKVEFTNQKKTGKIRVIKVDKDNNEIKLQNVEFDILDDKGNVVQHLVTNKKGETVSKELPINQKYIIKETKTQEKYMLDKQPQTVTLEENKITDITFVNELKKGKIEIYKTDSEDKNIKLKDIEFEVLDASNKVVEKIITDENGYAITSELPIGEYKIKEVKTDETHILNEEVINVKVKHNTIQKLNITNDRIVVKKLPKTGM